MQRRFLFGLISISARAYAVRPVRDRFIGVWKLVSYQRTSSAGKIDHPYGDRPLGRITYDRAGRMSAILMRPGRRSTVASGVGLIAGNATTDEIRDAVDGFIAYYGKYDIDVRSTSVIHHVEACLVPSWVGTDLRRSYEFSGQRLTLKAAVAGNVAEIVWERESA